MIKSMMEIKSSVGSGNLDMWTLALPDTGNSININSDGEKPGLVPGKGSNSVELQCKVLLGEIWVLQ